MKKFILTLAALAALAALLTSCNKDVRVREQADSLSDYGISFKLTQTPLTRAAETSAANMTAFKVTAIGNGANYFTDENVAVSAGACTMDKTYYWPAYELGFFAYANETGGTAAIANASKKVNGVTPVAAAADQKDFVVAYNTGTKAANMAGGVALNFRHALSQVIVKAQNLSTSGITISVNGVKVGNVKSSGDFTYPAAVTNPNNGGTLARSLWDVSGASSTTYSISGTAAAMPTASTGSMMFAGTSWMLVPQQLTAWDLANDKTNTGAGSYLALNVQIKDAAGNQLYPATAGQYAWTHVPVGTEWEPGKKYTYTLNFLDEANGGGAGVDDNGDPVLGSPIAFTLTVDDWDAVAQSVTVLSPQPVPDPSNGHAYVDLGLRSGGNKILFATMNVGANSPEEYGDYFAWGETSKRYTSISGTSIIGSTFEWSNCPYHTGSVFYSGWTKYVPSDKSSYWGGIGSPDNLLTLEESDDVAIVQWGGSWRMPDLAELEYLISSNVIGEWTDDYGSTGVSGYIATGKGSYSASSVFLPSSGTCEGSSVEMLGMLCSYPSRTINYDNPSVADGLFLVDGYFDTDSQPRYSGFPVRPVLVIPE